MAAEGSSARLGRTAARYAVKYGPLVYEAVKHGREPAQRAVQKAFARQTDRRKAFQHASTVVEGTVLRVFHDGEPVWVVFSGDDAVTSYPAVPVPLPDLLSHADLSQRTPPPTQRRMSDLARQVPDAAAKVPGVVRQVPGAAWKLPGAVRRTVRRNPSEE